MSTCNLLDPIALIDQSMPPGDEPHLQAARYALQSGGKRLRPKLVLATAESFGAPQDLAMPSAIALEFIHTYSLIHDDLPAMDNDDFRRGKPTVHKAFDEATAILAGDTLLTRAFEVVATAAIPESIRLAQLQLISKAAGGEGMIQGQMLDLMGEGEQLTLQQLQMMHEKKTGALIACAIGCGGIAAGAPLEPLTKIGLLAGLAFQIIDDVLDIENPYKKKRSSDQINGKSTYVSLLGIEKAKLEASKLYDEAVGLLESLNPTSNTLGHILHQLVHRTV